MKKLLFLVCCINNSYTMTPNRLANHMTLRQRVFAKYALNAIPVAIAVYNTLQGNSFKTLCGLENLCGNPDICRLGLSMSASVAEFVGDTTPYCTLSSRSKIKNCAYALTSCSMGVVDYPSCSCCLIAGSNLLARLCERSQYEYGVENTSPGQEAMEV